MLPPGFSIVPRGATAQAVLITVLYGLLVMIVLYAPIGTDAPVVKLFGSPHQARQVLTAFVRFLFWPLVILLAITAARGCFDFALNRARRR
jgi:hypothetical protein